MIFYQGTETIRNILLHTGMNSNFSGDGKYTTPSQTKTLHMQGKLTIRVLQHFSTVVVRYLEFCGAAWIHHKSLHSCYDMLG